VLGRKARLGNKPSFEALPISRLTSISTHLDRNKMQSLFAQQDRSSLLAYYVLLWGGHVGEEPFLCPTFIGTVPFSFRDRQLVDGMV